MRRVPAAIAIALFALAGPALAASDPSSDYDFNLHLMILALCLVPVIYFLPSVLAATRNNPKDGQIFLINLTLGWTLVGWVFCMVWAATTRSVAALPVSGPLPTTLTAVPATPTPADAVAQEIEDLALQKHRYLISEAEYDQRKRAILERWAAVAAAPAPAAPH